MTHSFPTRRPSDLSQGTLVGYRGKAAAIAARAPRDAQRRGEQQSAYAHMFGQRLDRALRQPLGRIIANADTISGQLQGPLRRDYANYASDIAAAGRHLMELVDDLADLQAIDRHDFNPVIDRKSTRLNSSTSCASRMPSY